VSYTSALAHKQKAKMFRATLQTVVESLDSDVEEDDSDDGEAAASQLDGESLKMMSRPSRRAL